ncbi:hypothetical protein N0V82_001320 [Gnomoniopsis sp. IMI 355080]|nr:hypothetical protein N0V82_001320 [Gnomoniopsis sp. IMI 355080]
MLVALHSTSGTATLCPIADRTILPYNRHWRYISSFHGPWLQLPPEILETLAHINYNTPLPRPIDPAVFYDLLKIRRLVDDSTDLSVRAASGLVSLKSLDNSHHANALGLGLSGANQPKLSAERKHKLREQATQKLARAYRLDEIACSVATMQSASSLEDVASLVLKRDVDNLNAKYVHFFHEKIPSRQLAESTSLDVLDEVIARQPSEGEALRTRATVRVFKEDYKGAAKDLTSALTVLKTHNRHKTPEGSSKELQVIDKNSRRVDVKLDEDQQPSSLEVQLLFARAGVYLSIACLHVNKSLEPLPAGTVRDSPDVGSSEQHVNADKQADAEDTETAPSTPNADTPPISALSAEEEAATARILDARKVVKTNAKKALRDYMAYLSAFHYSPNLPTDIADDFARRVKAGKNKGRGSNIRSESPSGDWQHKVYTLNELFTATPPTDVPPYPPTDMPVESPAHETSTYLGSTMEMVTYHPLLTDALHALLLAHVLVQTSTKELQRHAHMVARIARLADGYPIFQASRSPARADWIEVLRQGNNWIGLASSWETLCSPSSLYQPSANSGSSSSNGNGLKKALLPAPKDAEMDKEAIHQEALRRAFEDDRVGDEEMFRVAYQAHKKAVEADIKAQHDRVNGNGNAATGSGIVVPIPTNEAALTKPKPAAIETKDLTPTGGEPVSPGTAHRRWAMDEGREYPILTERASAVARWQREAPAGAGGTGAAARRRKKPVGHAVPCVG